MTTAIDEETCRACGSGFAGGLARVHMNNGGIYHEGCVDGAMEYERGKDHGRQDLEMSQRHCRDLQQQLDEAKREIARLKMSVAEYKNVLSRE
jgi:hypothetical protein